jgi:Base plate wedge protein 53
MATKYSGNSPYYTTPFVNGYLDIINFRNITPQKDDIEYDVDPKYENRPDLLAYDMYGDQSYWWVFAVRNKDVIKDPIFDLTPGTTIFLPSMTTITNSLNS